MPAQIRTTSAKVAHGRPIGVPHPSYAALPTFNQRHPSPPLKTLQNLALPRPGLLWEDAKASLECNHWPLSASICVHLWLKSLLMFLSPCFCQNDVSFSELCKCPECPVKHRFKKSEKKWTKLDIFRHRLLPTKAGTLSTASLDNIAPCHDPAK